MMIPKIKYPVGEQSFEALRREGYLYVDKTHFIEKILDQGKYYFLSRPRRFGKSLLLSTIKCFFEGKRDLFNGLHLDNYDWDWQPYPVLHLDLNIDSYSGPDTLKSVLSYYFEKWEAMYDVTSVSLSPSMRFHNIIEAAHKKCGRPVVILVDEYDKPLVYNIDNRKIFSEYRDMLMGIYSNFKSCADHIRMVCITGVSRFARLSVFSGLNNLRDISLSEQFSAICGITQGELEENFQQGLEELSRQHALSKEQILNRLKERYDGYRFSVRGEDIYNPFSLMQVMSDLSMRNYWIDSAIPTILAKQLLKNDVDLAELVDSECSESELRSLNLENPSPLSLLYQTGYITIKDFDPETELIRVGWPNKEVVDGFFSYLLPYYTSIHYGKSESFIKQLATAFNRGYIEKALKLLESLFASVSYEMRAEVEINLHNALLMIVKMLGFVVAECEYHTSDGRIDILIKTEMYCYILEIKLDGSPEEALAQIEEKKYYLPFRFENRRIIKVGINFSSVTRRIDGWIVAE